MPKSDERFGGYDGTRTRYFLRDGQVDFLVVNEVLLS